jgi:hypothetical protein
MNNAGVRFDAYHGCEYSRTVWAVEAIARLKNEGQGQVPETVLSQRYLLAWRYLQFSATLKLAWR